jgi:hypothetical protein
LCEVWKWIIIGTLVPLLLVRIWHLPFFGAEKWVAWLGRVARYQRLWWFGCGVLVFSVIVYAAHCR